MITKLELIQYIKAIEGCKASIEFVNNCADMDEVIKTAPPEYFVIFLRHYPQFAEYCDWNKLNGGHWINLLRYQPQFAEYCDWSTLDSHTQAYLLKYQL